MARDPEDHPEGVFAPLGRQCQTDGGGDDAHGGKHGEEDDVAAERNRRGDHPRITCRLRCRDSGEHGDD
ncbi:hypothetical protein [Streptomyces sp. NPDC056669]|uniref:hypothetical protein n=1 Tax=Streptomyces sp. NPDC056669 TaxID=3345903 RepID=UPI0036A13155